MLNGIKPHPFFFIQKPIVEKEFVGKLKNLMQDFERYV